MSCRALTYKSDFGERESYPFSVLPIFLLQYVNLTGSRERFGGNQVLTSTGDQKKQVLTAMEDPLRFHNILITRERNYRSRIALLSTLLKSWVAVEKPCNKVKLFEWFNN